MRPTFHRRPPRQRPLLLLGVLLVAASLACSNTVGTSSTSPGPAAGPLRAMTITAPSSVLPSAIGAYQGDSVHVYDNTWEGFSRGYSDGSPIAITVYSYPPPYGTVRCRGDCVITLVNNEMSTWIDYSMPALVERGSYDSMRVTKDTTWRERGIPIRQLSLAVERDGERLISYYVLMPWGNTLLKVRMTGPDMHPQWPAVDDFVRELLDTVAPVMTCPGAFSQEDPIAVSREIAGPPSAVGQAVHAALAGRDHRFWTIDESRGVWITEPINVLPGREEGAASVAIPAGVQLVVLAKPGEPPILEVQAVPVCAKKAVSPPGNDPRHPTTLPMTEALAAIKAISDSLGE